MCFIQRGCFKDLKPPWKEIHYRRKNVNIDFVWTKRCSVDIYGELFQEALYRGKHFQVPEGVKKLLEI